MFGALDMSSCLVLHREQCLASLSSNVLTLKYFTKLIREKLAFLSVIHKYFCLLSHVSLRAIYNACDSNTYWH